MSDKRIVKAEARDLMVDFLVGKLTALPPKLVEPYTRIRQADDWIFAQDCTNTDVIRKLMNKYDCNRYEAMAYVEDALIIFSHNRKINKDAELFFHIERIKSHIRLAEESNKIELLPKLNDSLTNALAQYNGDAGAETPRNIIFNITKNELNIGVMESSMAVSELEKITKFLGE
jgi:hypothetical protein